jgi:hypothetical protein
MVHKSFKGILNLNQARYVGVKKLNIEHAQLHISMYLMPK